MCKCENAHDRQVPKHAIGLIGRYWNERGRQQKKGYHESIEGRTQVRVDFERKKCRVKTKYDQDVLPSILLRSALWRSGFSSAIRFRSFLAQTMKAFIGRRMRCWLAESCAEADDEAPPWPLWPPAGPAEGKCPVDLEDRAWETEVDTEGEEEDGSGWEALTITLVWSTECVICMGEIEPFVSSVWVAGS